MLLTTDYATLTQKLNEWYNESAKERVEDWIGQKLFDVSETDWQVYNYLILNGLAKFDRVAEGAQLPVASSVEGDNVTATQRRYGGRVSITKDMRKFERYDQMQELVRSEVDYAFDRIDQSQADLLTNGFSGTTYTDIFGNSQSNTSPDAVVFFSASHTNNQNGNTARNLIRSTAGTANPALTRDGIVSARKDGKQHKDPNSVNRPITLDTLIVSATNEDLAERTVYSDGVVATPNRDMNPLKAKVKNIIAAPRGKAATVTAPQAPSVINPDGTPSWTAFWAEIKRLGVTREGVAAHVGGDLEVLMAMDGPDVAGVLEEIKAKVG